MYGSKLIKISNRQNKLIKVNNFDATFLFFMKYDTPTLNMRPPSTGPRGSRLNKPTPRLITYSQKNNLDSQKNAIGIKFPNLSDLIFVSRAATVIPKYPDFGFSGLFAAVISYRETFVLSFILSPGFKSDSTSLKLFIFCNSISFMLRICSPTFIPDNSAGKSLSNPATWTPFRDIKEETSGFITNK